MKHLIAILAMLALPVWGQTNYLTLGDGSRLTLNGAGYRLSVGAATSPYWTDPNSYTALWEMETTNATQTLDTSGNAYNASNMPSVAAGPAWTIVGTNQVGRVEHGYTFDGSDDYFVANDGTQWNSPNTSGVFNVWVKSTDTVAEVFSHFDNGGAFPGISLSLGRSATAGIIQFYNNGWYTIITNTPTEWTMYSLSFYQDAGVGMRMRFYTNAVPVKDMAIGAAFAESSSQFRIGNSVDGSRPLAGLIDNLLWIQGSSGAEYPASGITNWYIYTHPTNNMRLRP